VEILPERLGAGADVAGADQGEIRHLRRAGDRQFGGRKTLRDAEHDRQAALVCRVLAATAEGVRVSPTHSLRSFPRKCPRNARRAWSSRGAVLRPECGTAERELQRRDSLWSRSWTRSRTDQVTRLRAARA